MKTGHLVEGGVQGLDKAAGLQNFGVYSKLDEVGGGQIEFVHGPGDGHVKQPSFFVETIIFHGSGQREKSVRSGQQEDDGKLQSFCLVHGGEA